MSSIVKAVLCGAALSVSAATGLYGQTIGAGAHFESYLFGDESALGIRRVSLLTAPFAAGTGLTSWSRIDVTGAFASGRAQATDGTESAISGLTDTVIQLSLPLGGNRFGIAAAVLLPTGKSSFAADEIALAGLVAADLMPFRISNWGSGGGVDVSSQATASSGRVNFGARVGYAVSREFDLLDDGDLSYQPGNKLYVRLAADGNAGAGRLAAVAMLQRFGEDAVNSQNLYRAGNRAHGTLSYSMPMGRRGRAQLYASALHCQSGVFLDGSEGSPAQTLFMFGGGLRHLSSFGAIMPSVDVRLLRASDGRGQGYIGGAGAAIEMPMGRATLLPTARVRFGRILVADGIETGITGFDVGASLRLGRRQD